MIIGQNYNFNFSDLKLYPITTIEYRTATQDYEARVGLNDVSTGKITIWFNSYHKNFDAATANIANIRNTASGHPYNIFGTVLAIHNNTPNPGCTSYEVLALINSYQY